MNPQLNMALIGGGKGSLIGPVHWRSATLFDQSKLVSGVFSSDALRSAESAASYNLNKTMGFATLEELIAFDKKQPTANQIDFITIATPNHLHCRDAKIALKHGYHVVCDKPLSHDLNEAKELYEVAKMSPKVFALTHNYTGYPMVRFLRKLVREGELGEILSVRVRYLQGWLSTSLEKTGHRQAGWRTDPAKSGVSGCFADIGTHAFNLMRFVTNLRPLTISAQLQTMVPGRSLDDFGEASLVLENKARAHITASQISQGYRNHLVIELDGTKGSSYWCQENPELVVVKKNQDADRHYYREQVECQNEEVRNASSLPAGHPEGYIEGFANIYKEVFKAIHAVNKGKTYDSSKQLFPTIDDGIEGMNFIYKSVESSKNQNKWIEF